MLISEYIKETEDLERRFEKVAQEDGEAGALELLRLFDAIECRRGDVCAWHASGLTDDAEVPAAPTRLLFPSFKRKETRLVTVLVCRACHEEGEEHSMEATVSPSELCQVCRRSVDPEAAPEARTAREGTYFWVMRHDTGEVLTNPYPREAS